MTKPRDQRIEEEARRIALDHDLDPDDARLGYPAWRIPWILEQAAATVDGELTDGGKDAG
jgi:hypothetical protein